jgi:hypothetical protein
VNDSTAKRLIGLTAWAVCLCAAVVCFRNAIWRGFEYDELWTLVNFAGNDSILPIFRDLSVPNNHPLHSLLMQLVVNRTGVNELWVRLPSLIAGICLLALVPVAAWSITRDRTITALTATWCALNAALLHFAQTARGYTLQTTFLVCFALLIYRPRVNPQRAWLALSGAVLAGLAAFAVLPTSVLYLVAIICCDLGDRIWQWRQNDRIKRRSFFRDHAPALAAHGLLLALVGGWLWLLAPQLADARSMFGQSITSLGAWLHFVGNALGDLWSWPVVLLVVIGLFFSPKKGLAASLAVVLIFPLAAAVVTRAGPARVYLPLVPFGIFAAALGMTRLLKLADSWLAPRWRSLVTVLVMLMPVFWLPDMLRQWTPVDWSQVVPKLRTLPPDLYVNYPTTAGYVIHYYFQTGVVSDVAARVPTGDVFTFACIGKRGERAQIQGMCPPQFHTVGVPVPPVIPSLTQSRDGMDMVLYRATRIGDEADGKPPSTALYFAAIGPMTQGAALAVIHQLESSNDHCDWIALNGFLSGLWPETTTGENKAAILLALTETDVNLSSAEWRQLAERWPGQVRFYRCGTGPIVENVADGSSSR